MDEDTLMGQVQARAKLSSRANAERAVRAVLETLAERIQSGLAEHLAAQLPHEVGEHLRRVAADPLRNQEKFSLDEFLRRVGARAGADGPQALYIARVVLEVIGEANSADMEKVRQVLPEEFRRLAEAGSEGPMG